MLSPPPSPESRHRGDHTARIRTASIGLGNQEPRVQSPTTVVEAEEEVVKEPLQEPSSLARSQALTLRDLSEIKALKKPPPPIRMLMEVCCLLFHIPPVKQPDDRSGRLWLSDYWEPARRYLLSDPFFLSRLRSYDASQISQAQRNKIRTYFQDGQFTAERVRNCSKAAHELYSWVSVLMHQEPAATPRRNASSNPPNSARSPGGYHAPPVTESTAESST